MPAHVYKDLYPLMPPFSVVSSRLTNNISCRLYRFINDKTLRLIVTHNLNISLTV